MQDLISRQAVIAMLAARKPWGTMTDDIVASVLDELIAKIDVMPDAADVPFHQQDRTRCVVLGAANHVMARFNDAHDAAEFARSRPGYEHAKAYVSLADAPVRELEGTVPVVLYFGNQRDADEFTTLVQQAKPGLVARML